jgi:hypothetical protein
VQVQLLSSAILTTSDPETGRDRGDRLSRAGQPDCFEGLVVGERPVWDLFLPRLHQRGMVDQVGAVGDPPEVLDRASAYAAIVADAVYGGMRRLTARWVPTRAPLAGSSELGRTTVSSSRLTTGRD